MYLLERENTHFLCHAISRHTKCDDLFYVDFYVTGYVTQKAYTDYGGFKMMFGKKQEWEYI